MATRVRPTNKNIWAMDEAIDDHDPDIAELLEQLMSGLEGRRNGTAQIRQGRPDSHPGDQHARRPHPDPYRPPGQPAPPGAQQQYDKR